MLQIATGRFFRSATLHEHPDTARLFSNFSWEAPIVAGEVRLVPDASGRQDDVHAWTVHYVNRMERHDVAGALVRVGDVELVEQIQQLCSLALNAFFHSNAALVRRMCRPESGTPRGQHEPSLFVGRTLDRVVKGDIGDASALQPFFDRVLTLPRDGYLAVVGCARTLTDSLIAVPHNIHLAYSMLVYALESLSQRFDEFVPGWEHLEEETRHELERVLSGIPSTTFWKVQQVLIEREHVKLGARFVEFVTRHVDDSFFLHDTASSRTRLGHSDLRRALQTAYATRSGFVHKLEPLRHQITSSVVADAEVFEWDGRPYLTYRGLVRLLRHVVLKFVERSQPVESETVDWRRDLPGVVRLYSAPQYWIWDVQGYTAAHAWKALGGLISHLNDLHATEGLPIADMRQVIRRSFELMPDSKAREQRYMLMIAWLYNMMVSDELRVDRWVERCQRHEHLLEQCCVERLLIDIIRGDEWSWGAAECVSCVEEYLRTCHHKGVVKFPRQQRRALMLGAYNTLLPGDPAAAQAWARRARLDNPNAPWLQRHISTLAERLEPFDLRDVMWRRADKSGA